MFYIFMRIFNEYIYYFNINEHKKLNQLVRKCIHSEINIIIFKFAFNWPAILFDALLTYFVSFRSINEFYNAMLFQNVFCILTTEV